MYFIGKPLNYIDFANKTSDTIYDLVVDADNTNIVKVYINRGFAVEELSKLQAEDSKSRNNYEIIEYSQQLDFTIQRSIDSMYYQLIVQKELDYNGRSTGRFTMSAPLRFNDMVKLYNDIIRSMSGGRHDSKH